MEKSQGFRVAGATADIEFIAVNRANEQDVIFWEDIQAVFPGVKFVRRGHVVLSMLRDSNGIINNPRRIKHFPNEVLGIELSTTIDSTLATMDEQIDIHSAAPHATIHPESIPISPPSEVFSGQSQPAASEPIVVSSAAEPRLTTLRRLNTTDVHNVSTAMVEAIELADKSGQPLTKEQLTTLLKSKLNSGLPINSAFESTVFRKLDTLHDQGATTQQIVLKILEVQKQMSDRLILIQNRTEAILTQQLELAEFPIPRLFIVLPEKVSKYDATNWVRTKFRLYFICECGVHTQTEEGKTPHHLHLARHEGYVIREPTEFFKKYGPFLVLMLELIKISTSIASHAVPALVTFKIIELADSVQQTMETITEMIDYSLECIDKQTEKVHASCLGDLDDSDNRPSRTQQDLTNYLKNVEGLEGVELRQLGSFLTASKADNLLGNLYRMSTSDGHVKWVCRDHYRAGYQKVQVEKLRNIVESSGGKFDEQLGTVEMSLKSNIAATEFFAALAKAKGVIELIVDFNWECAWKDVDALRKAIKGSSVSTLHVDLQMFKPKPSLLRTQFSSSVHSRYAPLSRLMEPIQLRSVHLILPEDIIRLSNFTPTRPSHLYKLTFKMIIGRNDDGKVAKVLAEVSKSNSMVVSCYCSTEEKGAQALWQALKTSSTLAALILDRFRIREKGTQALAEALKTNSTLTTLDISGNSIGEIGAQALSEALKTNSTLTTFDMSGNKIGELGVQALSEALKTNSTLNTLNLWNNPIGEKGAQALSEALKINSTLTTLNMRYNGIGERGAQELAEALKTNSTLTSFNLWNNSIGEKGAEALSEALKTNSMLTTLNLRMNSIGEKGAQALAEALKINSTLTTLNLRMNSIGEKGAQALAEALKPNSMLITLEMGSNSIGDLGAWALSEAVKANSTLATLDLWNNSIGEKGAEALSEALKTNSTLTILNLRMNSIGEKGAQALAEALKANSTLIALEMGGNSIGDLGTWALSEAVKTNSTLATLDLWDNSIGDLGVQALSEALMTNSTLTSLDMGGNSIGEEGAWALSEALETNTNLTTLNLCNNSIGDLGAQAFSVALMTNSTLTTLDLRGNSISGFGAQALSEALRTNSMLTTLDMGGNSIGEEGASALSEALETNTNLTTLNLCNNSIGDLGAQAFSVALMTNSTLTTLDLCGNSISGFGAQALSEALRTNSMLTTLNLRLDLIGDLGA
ncbi:hypothetical protein EMPS_00763 [Entomortierella parvispora]|uniref:RNI-like protein n=1 Tax=Entomortierella parvispora TaxID=205924 RepID=A0A9P3H2B3_9FUNG|nr:hypothetical protein EMPS_00763 [Entomortierella parvispora]